MIEGRSLDKQDELGQQARNYASLDNKSVPLFKQSWLDRFTYVHPAVPHIIYIPVVVLMIHLTLESKIVLQNTALLFAGGILTWTLSEYIMHRYLFHFKPKGKWQYWIWYLFHGVHHDYPNDSKRLVMPPTVSIPLAILFYFCFQFILGPLNHFPLFAGFVVGYLIYDTIHYSVHNGMLPGRFGRLLRQQHMRHHFVHTENNFGVSSPLWDIIFGTLNKPELKESKNTK